MFFSVPPIPQAPPFFHQQIQLQKEHERIKDPFVSSSNKDFPPHNLLLSYSDVDRLIWLACFSLQTSDQWNETKMETACLSLLPALVTPGRREATRHPKSL